MKLRRIILFLWLAVMAVFVSRWAGGTASSTHEVNSEKSSGRVSEEPRLVADDISSSTPTSPLVREQLLLPPKSAAHAEEVAATQPDTQQQTTRKPVHLAVATQTDADAFTSQPRAAGRRKDGEASGVGDEKARLQHWFVGHPLGRPTHQWIAYQAYLLLRDGEELKNEMEQFLPQNQDNDVYRSVYPPDSFWLNVLPLSDNSHHSIVGRNALIQGAYEEDAEAQVKGLTAGTHFWNPDRSPDSLIVFPNGHVRVMGPKDGHECLSSAAKATVWRILHEREIKPHKIHG